MSIFGARQKIQGFIRVPQAPGNMLATQIRGKHPAPVREGREWFPKKEAATWTALALFWVNTEKKKNCRESSFTVEPKILSFMNSNNSGVSDSPPF